MGRPIVRTDVEDVHDSAIARVPWYVYGDYVLDAVAGIRRAEQIAVAWNGPIVQPKEVRRRLGGQRILPIIAQPAPHRIAYSIDAIVILPDGTIYDLRLDRPVQPAWPLSIDVLTPELTMHDLLRLDYVLKGYPELKVDVTLKLKLNADIPFLKSQGPAHPEVAIALLEFEPMAPWRSCPPAIAAKEESTERLDG